MPADFQPKDDPWAVAARPAPEGGALSLGVETFGPLEPLDAQFGADAPKFVPDAALEPLFGGSRRSYAIVDAAKAVGLVDMLKASGLPHRCLFKGAAEQELRDVAPWLVELAPEASLTRALFTEGPAAWHLWDPGLALFLRSEAPLDKVLAHLRRFTRVREPDGTWLMFRFWEPEIAPAFWASHVDQSAHIKWRYGAVLGDVLFQSGDQFVKVTCSAPEPFKMLAGDDVLASYRPLFAQIRWAAFQKKIYGALQAEPAPLCDASKARVVELCDTARSEGYRREAAIWNMVRAALHGAHHGHKLADLIAQAKARLGPVDDVSVSQAVLAAASMKAGFSKTDPATAPRG